MKRFLAMVLSICLLGGSVTNYYASEISETPEESVLLQETSESETVEESSEEDITETVFEEE